MDMAGDFRMSAEIVFMRRSAESTDAQSYEIHVCAQQF